MSIFDLILVFIIGAFGLFGLWFGLIHTLGSVLGTVFGAYLASRYYEPVAGWLIHVTGWSENFSRVLVFIIAFVIINRLVGLAFWLVDKVLSIITRLPFISSLNRILGLVLGLFEGALTLGLIFYFIERFPLSDKIMTYAAGSVVLPIVVPLAGVLVPLLPEALRMLKSTVDFAEGVFLKK
ncbi:MAG: CvpA family protein [Patescibacteria group bacterium]